MGAAKIPPRFTQELNLNAKYSHSEYTLPKVYEVSEKLTKAGVVKAGGRVEKDADGEEVLVIREATGGRNAGEVGEPVAVLLVRVGHGTDFQHVRVAAVEVEVLVDFTHDSARADDA